MNYHIGDRFLVEETQGRVCYINNGNAWLSPVSIDQESSSFRGKPLFLGLAFAKLNSKCFMPDGTKAYPVVTPTACGAI